MKPESGPHTTVPPTGTIKFLSVLCTIASTLPTAIALTHAIAVIPVRPRNVAHHERVVETLKGDIYMDAPGVCEAKRVRCNFRIESKGATQTGKGRSFRGWRGAGGRFTFQVFRPASKRPTLT